MSHLRTMLFTGPAVKITAEGSYIPQPTTLIGRLTRRNRLFAAPLLFAMLGIALCTPARADDDWVFAASGSVPLDAIQGGAEPDGTAVYICRAFFNNGVHPGRVRPGMTGCDIGWGGSEHLIPFYQVLVPRWVSADNGNIPPNAYSLGYEVPSVDGRQLLYPCRGYLNGSLQPGKVRPGLPGCSVGWGGKEIFLNPYEVLIAGPFYQLPVQNYQLGSGNIPFRLGPLTGGFEANGQPLYICLAGFNSGEHPGKTRPGLGGCNIGWGGAERSVSLQKSSALILNWKQPSNVSYLSFAAGKEANGDPLYVCMADGPNGGFYPGKYSPAFNACSIGFDGREVMANSFAILTDNEQIPH